MIKIAQTGFMAAKNFGKKHFATAVKSMKEMKAKVRAPGWVKSNIKAMPGRTKAFGTKHKVALVAGGGAAGTVAGYQSGKGRERKRAKAAITRFSFAQAADELGIRTPARMTSRSQRVAIIRQHNKNVDKRRAQYKKFYS
tara:strand:+ start:2072 stop:2491 length:420 start_codon:yes stop_codon:yes gene_type:complete